MKADVRNASYFFEKIFEANYEAFVKCLNNKRRDLCLTFFNVPAENGRHIQTTQPIECTFDTVRQRRRKTDDYAAERSIYGGSEFQKEVAQAP